jgi:5'-methylthioadenosine phosphorylase
VINMTQYPECMLAREQEISYVNISLITDYDAGLVGDDPDAHPVNNQEVVRMFRANLDNLRRIVLRMVETLPDTAQSPARNCLAVSRFV